ncbi:hypothetical protein [Methylocystis echinoides]|uniref:hypothetical protein n=1 Tax=Methylocystis echinoides TaxID=29468 RepID=UPI00341B42E1
MEISRRANTLCGQSVRQLKGRKTRRRLTLTLDHHSQALQLKEREIEASWPIVGLPETIHVDSGSDFRSNAFIHGCRNEGINIIWPSPGEPHYGGHIERLIGTMMGEMHLLPGTSFGNPIERGSHDSKKHPAMSLRELECYLGWEIAGGYHERIHSALMRSPAAIWRDHEDRVQFRMPHDRMAFWVPFLP